MNPSPAASLVPAAPLDDPQAARRAGRDDLSLMLIDARNRSLRWLAAFEAAGHLRGGAGPAASPLRCIGHAAWFQEYWIARHVQRGRGELAEHGVPRLPGLEARADAWFAPAGLQFDGHGPPDPSEQELRQYLSDTLELTLDLLWATPNDDQGLHVFRLALLHEDRLAERLAVAAQWLGIAPDDPLLGPITPPTSVGSMRCKCLRWRLTRRWSTGAASPNSCRTVATTIPCGGHPKAGSGCRTPRGAHRGAWSSGTAPWCLTAGGGCAERLRVCLRCM